jgi:hypothetical protein
MRNEKRCPTAVGLISFLAIPIAALALAMGYKKKKDVQCIVFKLAMGCKCRKGIARGM